MILIFNSAIKNYCLSFVWVKTTSIRFFWLFLLYGLDSVALLLTFKVILMDILLLKRLVVSGLVFSVCWLPVTDFNSCYARQKAESKPGSLGIVEFISKTGNAEIKRLSGIGKYASTGVYIPPMLEDCPVSYADAGQLLVVNLTWGQKMSEGVLAEAQPCIYTVDPQTKACAEKTKMSRKPEFAYALARGMDEAGKIIIGTQVRPESAYIFAEKGEGGCWNAETGAWYPLPSPDLSESPATEPGVMYVPVKISANGEYIVGEASTLKDSSGKSFAPNWKISMKENGFDLTKAGSKITYLSAEEAPQNFLCCLCPRQKGWYLQRKGAAPKRLSPKKEKKIIKHYRASQRAQGRLLTAGQRPSFVLWKKNGDFQYEVAKVFNNFSYNQKDFQFDYLVDLGEKGDVLFSVVADGVGDSPLLIAGNDDSGNYKPYLDLYLPLRLHRSGNDGSVDGYIAINTSEQNTQLVTMNNGSPTVTDYSTNMPQLFSNGWNPYMPLRCPRDNNIEVFYAAVSAAANYAIPPGFIVVTDPKTNKKAFESAYNWLASKGADASGDQRQYDYPAYFYGGDLSGNGLTLHGQIDTYGKGDTVMVDTIITDWVSQMKPPL